MRYSKMYKLFRSVAEWTGQFSKRQLIILGSCLLVSLISLVTLVASIFAQPNTNTQSATETLPEVTTHSTHDDTPPPAPGTPPPPNNAPVPAPPAVPFIFGVGTELDHAISHRITKESNIKLLSSWFNGTSDLGFMGGWKGTVVPQAYAQGYSLHLIIYSNEPEQNVDTSYGPACGRPYPVSPQLLSDMRQLAEIFKGGKLYVSMFTEFQTYPCTDNTWASSTNYYKALQKNYLAARDIFHQYAPGSQVSLTWGGWQTKWDDPGQGGGRSLFGYFTDVMNASDFQSFQAMSTTGNIAIITDMTKALAPYNGGVMVAHYKPDNRSQATFNADMSEIFTAANMAALQQNELFAFSFMDPTNMNSSEAAFQAVKNIVQTYAH